MTFAGYPVGSLPKDTAEGGRPGASWRSSDIEATFNLPRGMICPVHGGGHAIPRREAPPPPPPELRRSCHERSKAKWDEARDAHHYDASDIFPNDCYCSSKERAFRPGYGWAEPGKGWTRNRRRPISHRLRPDVHEKTRTTKNVMGKGDKPPGDRCDGPSVWDTQWAMSYLSRDSDIPRQRNSLQTATEEKAERHECQQGSRAAPPGSFKCSTGSRRRNVGHLAETHAMKHVGALI